MPYNQWNAQSREWEYVDDQGNVYPIPPEAWASAGIHGIPTGYDPSTSQYSFAPPPSPNTGLYGSPQVGVGYQWQVLAQKKATDAADNAYRYYMANNLDIPGFEWKKKVDARDFAQRVAEFEFKKVMDQANLADTQRNTAIRLGQSTGAMPGGLWWQIAQAALANAPKTTSSSALNASTVSSADPLQEAAQWLVDNRFGEDYRNWSERQDYWNATKRRDEETSPSDVLSYLRDWGHWNFPGKGLNAGGNGQVGDQELLDWVKQQGFQP